MKAEYRMIPISEIELGERRRTDYGDIAKLAAGIRKVGLLHPLIVQRVNSHFKVVAGGRRFKALQLMEVEAAPVRLYETLSEEEVRDIEIEENENRKDFTEYERRRTFAASMSLVEDVKNAGAVLAKVAETPATGRKAKHGVPKQAIAEVLDVSDSSIDRAEQHVKTAQSYPFMQNESWRQSHVLAVREGLEKIPEAEQSDAMGVLGCAKLLDPATAVDLIQNISAKTPVERTALYALSKSEDPRDRSRALSSAAELPPLPDPRLNSIATALTALGRATSPYPNDPITPALRNIIGDLRKVKAQVEAVSYNAKRDAKKEAVQ